MKVLHVIPSFAPAWRYGGPIVAALGLTKALARQGHDVTVMTTNIDGPGLLDVPLETAISMDDVSVWYYPVERPRWYCFSRPLGRALKERVADFDIAHIHSVFLWPTTIAAHWCHKHHVPYLIRPAGALSQVTMAKPYAGFIRSTTSRLKKALYLNTIGRMDLNHAAGIHYTSQDEMEAAKRHNLHPPKYVLPLGVEGPPKSRPSAGFGLRRKYPQLADKKIVLFLSRLDPIKGLDILVPAMAGVARDVDFALVIAGSGAGSYEEHVAAQVEKHALQDRTVFLGMVTGEDKWAVMRESDIFLLSCYHENFGVVVVEAMAAGLPVVISNRVNIHNEVSAAGAGLVTNLDPEEVASATKTLLADEDLRKRMGSAGRELARDEYSWKNAVGRVATVYESIVSARGRPSADLVSGSMR